MEMIIGCIFLTVLLIILLIVCKNVTINVNINQPEPKFYKIPDSFDENGDPVNDNEEHITIDDLVKNVNSIMLGEDEE